MGLYYPPAMTKIPLFKALKRYYCQRQTVNFEKHLNKFIGCIDCYTCSSWVGALALALSKLGADSGKNEIILTKYSCYEFTMAIKIAGLKPVYIDVSEDFKMQADKIEPAITDRTLAVLAVNNAGIFSNLQKIKLLCESKDIILIEDATYTLSGKYKGKMAGVWGDFAILNFSEGKAIPIGGGAVVLNSAKFISIFDEIKNYLRAKSSPGSLKDFVKIIIYIIGSKPLVYSLYRWIKKLFRYDIKEKMSMEHIRRVIDNQKGSIENPELIEDKQKLLEKLTLKNSLFKQSSAIEILKIINKNRAKRFEVVKKYTAALRNVKGIKLFDIDENMYFNRLPVLVKKLDVQAFETQSKRGLSRLYGTESDLYQSAMAEINSKNFYENLVTMSVFTGMKEKTVKRNCKALSYLIL